MQPRFNKVGLILGKRGSGKSLFTLGSDFAAKEEDRKLGIKSVITTALKTGKKVLVVDTLDHPAYRRIKILQQKEFDSFTSGVARVFMRPDQIAQLVSKINRSAQFYNSLIVFEDAGKYTESRLPKPFKELIADTKQKNIDLLFMYHCWSDTPMDMFRKGLDFIQLFKTEDHPIVRKNNIPLYEKIESIYQDVFNNPSRFYGRFIDTSTT